MSEVKMVILSTDDLDESIRFHAETLGMLLKFRDGAHFAALDGGRSPWHWPPRSTIPSPGRS
jgi:catechol 2,3-dioxygenase-like lactoylglutathione lyase family enzyme